MRAAPVARFLSPDWFAEVARANDAPPPPGSPSAASDDLVLEQVVRDTPEGDVRYRVVVRGAVALIDPPVAQVAAEGMDPRPAPDLTITCDWTTAVELAQGILSAQAALLAGRLRVRGNLSRLTGRASALAGLDPVPASVRRHTTY
jgi:hypothetical protein